MYVLNLGISKCSSFLVVVQEQGVSFLEYMSAEDAARVVAALRGLDTGDGRKIEAVYCNPLALSMHKYMLSIQLYETQEVTTEMWQGMERN